MAEEANAEIYLATRSRGDHLPKREEVLAAETEGGQWVHPVLEQYVLTHWMLLALGLPTRREQVPHLAVRLSCDPPPSEVMETRQMVCPAATTPCVEQAVPASPGAMQVQVGCPSSLKVVPRTEPDITREQKSCV